MKTNKILDNYSPLLQGGVVPQERRGSFVLFKLFCVAIFFSVLATTLLLFGCSARKTRPTQLQVHPTNWLVDHPTFIFANTLEPEFGIACQSCHGVDYTGGTSGVSCVGCHNQRRDSTQRLIVCTGCHGGYLGDSSGAPPYSLSRDSIFADRGVGGHGVMVNGGALFAGTDCQTCHIKPVFVLASSHFTTSGQNADGRAEVLFSGLAQVFPSRYGSPRWNSDSGTCANIYCHGAFPGGDTARVVKFYGGPPQAFCGSCHAAQPDDDFATLSGQHKKHDSLGIQCITCHFSTVDSSNSIRPASGRHVNGLMVEDVVFDPSVDSLRIGLFDGVSCSGLPDSPTCHANTRTW